MTPIPSPRRTIVLGPPYRFFSTNVPFAEMRPDRQARAGPYGMQIRNELFSGFYSRTVIAAVLTTFQIFPGESAVRVTVSCPVQGSLGFIAFGFASVGCYFESILHDPIPEGTGTRALKGMGAGLAHGGLNPFPLFLGSPFFQGPLVATTFSYVMNLIPLPQSAGPRELAVNCTMEGGVTVDGFAHAFIEGSVVPTFTIEVWYGFQFP